MHDILSLPASHHTRKKKLASSKALVRRFHAWLAKLGAMQSGTLSILDELVLSILDFTWLQTAKCVCRRWHELSAQVFLRCCMSFDLQPGCLSA